MENQKLRKDDNIFTVSLDGITLNEDQKNQIDKAIKSAVMVELARIESPKDLIINNNLNLHPRYHNIKKPFIYGIWVESFERYRERLIDHSQLDLNKLAEKKK